MLLSEEEKLKKYFNNDKNRKLHFFFNFLHEMFFFNFHHIKIYDHKNVSLVLLFKIKNVGQLCALHVIYFEDMMRQKKVHCSLFFHKNDIAVWKFIEFAWFDIVCISRNNFDHQFHLLWKLWLETEKINFNFQKRE